MRQAKQWMTSNKHRLFATICVAGLTLILTACATMTDLGGARDAPPPQRAAFCDVAKPIGWAVLDTNQTIAEVKAHNAVGKRLCDWGKKSDGK